jgi:hypothetical protein
MSSAHYLEAIERVRKARAAVQELARPIQRAAGFLNEWDQRSRTGARWPAHSPTPIPLHEAGNEWPKEMRPLLERFREWMEAVEHLHRAWADVPEGDRKNLHHPDSVQI